MATLQDYRNERLRKLEQLKGIGINPYPANVCRTRSAGDITTMFEELQGSEVTVAGRVVALRKFGKLAFVVIRDYSGRVQLFIREGEMDNLDAASGRLGVTELPLLDTGDFVEATGQVVRTQTGEISVSVKSLRLIAKSLRPMPTELTNKEERLRRRYVDMNVNQDVRDRFVRRSKFWQSTRDFLNNNGFLEINIPVLEHTTGGADANPFVTRMDALSQDFYLRISHELPLKRLIGAGFEKVYDIGPRFRNENYSDEHLPEHVAMEWYWAYADWHDGMKLMEEWYSYALQQTFGTLQFTINGMNVDMSKPWEVWDYETIIRERYGIDVYKSPLEDIKKALAENKLEVEQTENRSRGIDKLWKNIRKDVAGPVWLINTPKFISPLAKANPENPETTQRFQAVIAGSELCNGFSELNDPQDQLQRFVEQQAMREAGDSEAMMLDIDYVEMLEYGMPPACGLGISERVFWIFEGVSAREGVPFPQLRYELDETTKEIYHDVPLTTSAHATAPAVDRAALPESAAEQGTRKLYLDNYSTLECDAKAVAVEDLGEDTYRLVLDQTVLYPGGGGQACDLGRIVWEGGSLELQTVSKDHDGIVYHDGVLEGVLPQIGQTVHANVAAERRMLNSKLHCAGHLLDYAVKKCGLAWKSGKSAHYPHMSFVDYAGEYVADEADSLARSIEAVLDDVSEQGGSIGVKRVPSEDAHMYSDYIPQAVLDSYQYVHVATYPDNFNICCGGTHLADLHELGKVNVTKIKKKDGAIRVSYKVEGG